MDEMNDGVTDRPSTKFCTDCGASISRRAEICPQCGVRQLTVAPAKGTSNTVLKGCLFVLLIPVALYMIGITCFSLLRLSR